ncbi:MAG: cell division protein ZapA [Alphaproteobacteria bacterium]|nr:cell division protein ZapA [Alphaproteobacteria bacterium]MBN2779556.1 cell division protein ZapA [Alphaproteobacteria bacterium]
MSQVIFTIDQKDYPIGCPESQKPRLEKLAELVAKKENEVVDIMGASISHEMLLVMIIVTLSDELDRVKNNPQTTTTAASEEIDLSPLHSEVHDMIRLVKILKDSIS